jgi:hypothetical protein
MIPGVLLYGAGGASFAHVILAFTTATLIDLEWRRHSKAAVPSTPIASVETN